MRLSNSSVALVNLCYVYLDPRCDVCGDVMRFQTGRVERSVDIDESRRLALLDHLFAARVAEAEPERLQGDAARRRSVFTHSRSNFFQIAVKVCDSEKQVYIDCEIMLE